ncbi:MAG: Mur ligase family protein, partial [Bacteroidia bacterium]|nr:Mur ligase family protein [Bacteroidia bacterium]
MTYIDIRALYERFMSCGQKITTDTRKIEQGSMFFALKGENFDANTFVNSAIEQGCCCAVTDDAAYANGNTILLVPDVLQALQQLAKYHRKALNIPVIGITGSNGKTTNKELIHAVLSKKYSVYATKGNLNNHIGVPLTLLSISSKHEMAIVEMGANHQGEIAFLSD